MDGGSHETFRIVPYAPWHLKSIALQPHQEHLNAFLSRGDFAERLLAAGPAWSAMAGGRPIACGGFEDNWTGRATCWAVLSDETGKHMLALTRAVRKGIWEHPAERIETTVVDGYEPGLRWARLLGFEEEGVRRRYHLGQDHRAFAIIKYPTNPPKPIL